MIAERDNLPHNQLIWDHFNDAVLVCNRQGQIVTANQAFERLTGFAASVMQAQQPHHWSVFLFQEHHHRTPWTEWPPGGKTWQGEFWCRRLTDDPFPVLITICMQPHGDTDGFLVILRDLSSQKAAELLLNTQFNYDILTGLPNRQLFLQRLQHLCTQQEPFALMVLDLDDMKLINTSTDHQTGDEILCAVARRLSGRKQANDLLARIGGDEFALLLPGIRNHEQALNQAEALMGCFDWPFQLTHQQVYMSAAMGVAVWREDSLAQEELLSDAEYALFAAKRRKSVVELYSRELRQNQQNRQQLQQDLAYAIKYHQLTLVYQPILDIRSHRVMKLEALVRWQHPTRGLISPAEFVPLAEECGLIQSLGQWILFHACADLKRLHHLGFAHLQMAINRSTPEFQTIDVEATEWLSTIRDMGLQPSSIIFEITESLLMNHQDSNLQRIQALRAAGCQIAIDDFGTGYSALSYLRNFPLDVVKIDQSFIRSIANEPQEQVLLDGIIHLITSLGLDLVVEGVETEAQLAYLAKRPCPHIQGFLVSKPLALPALLNYLHQGKTTYTAHSTVL